jgi:fumarate reductase flavoprotein subunit
MVDSIQASAFAGIRDEPPSADIIVVGGGAAGLAAAVSAGIRGVRTILLEKDAKLGGTTGLSVGSFSAACTRLQRRAGIIDGADDFRSDMEAFAGDLVVRDNPDLRSMLAAEAGVTLSWLEDIGIVFAGPFPEPPNRVNRMHNVIPGSRTYVIKLARAAKRAGVMIELGVTVDRLVADSRGRVVAVDCTQAGRRHRLWARRGVILAAGDFSGSQELRKEFLSPAAQAAIPINPRSSGDGHQMARRVGAALRNMDAVFGPQLRFPRARTNGLAERLPDWSWLARLGAQYLMRAPPWMLKPLVTSLLIAHMSPSERLFQEGAILVDLDGERLTGAKLADALATAREPKGYILLDEHVASRFTKYPFFISTAPGIAYAYFPDYARGRPDLVHRARNVHELAAKTGIPAERLTAATRGLEGWPLYALGPVHAMLTVTEGGLAVDAQCRVLRQDGSPVEGLYGAGGVGQGGMLLKGHGLHIAWALTSGRVAGEMAARRPPAEPEASSQRERPGSSEGRPIDESASGIARTQAAESISVSAHD